MSRPMQFPKRFPWLIVALVMLTGLPVLPVAAWFWLVTPPLQNYYLITYLDSTERGSQPDATTKVEWLLKTAPGRKPEVALGADVVSATIGNGNELPVKLSPRAVADGWREVAKSEPQQVESAKLERYLEAQIFDGRGIWRMVMQPLFACAAAVLFLLGLRAWWKTRAKHEERHGRRTKGPEWSSPFMWNKVTMEDGIRFQLQWGDSPSSWKTRLPFGPSYRIPRRLESSHIMLMGDTGSGKSSAIRQILRQVQERGETAIVYDPAMDFLGEFYDPKRGDLILNPLDARCPYWSLGAELLREETATTIAAAFLPDKEYEKAFFTDGPRRILAHLLKQKPQPRDILRWMSDPDRVEGFAPTSRAAQKLGEAGIETKTLQAHLSQGQKVDTGEKRLYMVDESSLASTRQMHEFVCRLHPNERVLLVGDTRQHESVEAGRIFAQLQEAGMKTVRLDEIVRQKDPELKQTVEQLARGEVGLAIAGLDRQGRIHEVRSPEERIAAIAKEYAKSPDNTLVVSPDNRSRTEINQAIHTELQAKGVVSKEEHPTKVLVPRQDLTGADRMWAARYNEGDVLRYSRTSQETGIPKGEYARVTQVDAPNNRLTVELKDGTEKSYDPRRQQGVSVYREQERAFSTGDRVQLTAPVSEMKLANRELGTVERIAEGRMSVKMDGGREVQLDPVKHPHLDHGYAVTSHSSQGQTADRVLINVDTELGAKDLLNNRMAYVSVSRGAYDAQLFTDSREKLGAALGHDVSHTSAHTPDPKPPQRELAEAPKQEKSQDLDVGLSL